MEQGNEAQLFWGICLVVLSIGFGFIEDRKLRNLPKESDDKIFNVSNKTILRLRLWTVLLVFWGYGLWLLLTY